MASPGISPLWCGDVSDGSDQSEAPGVTNDQSEAAPPPACLGNNGVDSGWPGPEERTKP